MRLNSGAFLSLDMLSSLKIWMDLLIWRQYLPVFWLYFFFLKLVPLLCPSAVRSMGLSPWASQVTEHFKALSIFIGITACGTHTGIHKLLPLPVLFWICLESFFCWLANYISLVPHPSETAVPSSGWFPDPVQLVEFPVISFNFGSQYYASFLLMLPVNFLLTLSSVRSHSWGTANSISCPQCAFKIALWFSLTPTFYSHSFAVVPSSWKCLLGSNTQMCSGSSALTEENSCRRAVNKTGLELNGAAALRKEKHCSTLQSSMIWMRYKWLT